MCVCAKDGEVMAMCVCAKDREVMAVVFQKQPNALQCPTSVTVVLSRR